MVKILGFEDTDAEKSIATAISGKTEITHHVTDDIA